jgi:undecaprenyl-diphosphatase
VKGFFVVVSRLGDGIFWYFLMALLPLWFGMDAVRASLHMGFVALAGLALYKYLKSHLVRQRPYLLHRGITLGTAPLDAYSFPSGHTLHAVAFTIVALSYYPQLAWLLIPFAGLVAVSRVLLGLHYPSDVLAGAVIGALLAAGSLMVLP